MDVKLCHEALGVLWSDAIKGLEGALSEMLDVGREGLWGDGTFTRRDSGKLKPRMNTWEVVSTSFKSLQVSIGVLTIIEAHGPETWRDGFLQLDVEVDR